MTDEGPILTDREKWLLGQAEARAQLKFAALYERVINLENQLQKLVDLISSVGQPPEEPEGDLLSMDQAWIDDERSKSTERRKREGRVPFG